MLSSSIIEKIISHSELPRDMVICTDQESIRDFLKEPKKNYICIVEESIYREPGSRGKKDHKKYPYYSIVIVSRNTLETRGDYAQFSPNDIESGEAIFMMTFFITEKNVYFDYTGIAPEYRCKKINTECWLNLLEMLLSEGIIDKSFFIESDANHIAVWKFFNRNCLTAPPNFEEGSVKCTANVSDIICAHRQDIERPKQGLADTLINETMCQLKIAETKRDYSDCIILGLSLLTQVNDIKKLHILLADEVFKTKVITADELRALVDDRIKKLSSVSQVAFFSKKAQLETKPKRDLGIETLTP